MTNEPGSRWQDLPTVVELTEEGSRRQQSAQKMAALLDDVLASEAGAPEGKDTNGWSVEALVRDFRFGGEDVPTVVSSAAPLLNLAHALRKTEAQPDIEELRRATMDGIRRYERDLASARISPDRARAAHYVVCATVDDVILSKPWGVRAGWARTGLVPTFHMDVTGGDRVFDLLDHFHQAPSVNKDLLLLIYLCLSLAFEGRTRVSPRGALELARIREGLYKTLLGQFGIFERELSPHWRGVTARHEPLRASAALWTVLSILALIFGLGYLFFTLTLNSASDGTFQRLASLEPSQPASIAFIERPEPVVEVAEVPPEPIPEPEPEPIPPPEPPPKPTALENLIAFLQPEVERGTITLADSDGRLLVRIRNAGLFQTGSADVGSEFTDLLNRIGGALAAENYRAVVIGYTDNVPIQAVQYPSNWHLSAARAKAVGDILARLAGPGAILTEGRADSDPLASNDTEEGREANRRTEILVLTDPTESLEAVGIAPHQAASPTEPAPAEEDGP